MSEGNDQGSMTVSAGGGSSGVHWGGGNGNGNGGGSSGNKGDSSSGNAVAAIAVFGMPVTMVSVEGFWNITLFNTAAIESSISAALTSVEKGLVASLPYAGRLLGAGFAILAPSTIAPDDKSYINHTFTSIPADEVMTESFSALPTQPATVAVSKRITDDIQDERQHLSITKVSGIVQNIPLVQAKPTTRSGVFNASVIPGMPDIRLTVSSGKPVTTAPSKSVTTEKTETRLVGFTSGANTYDAVIRFPPEYKIDPVYVAITGVLSVSGLKKRQEEESQRQEERYALHPDEAAERDFNLASNSLDEADQAVITAQKVLTDKLNEQLVVAKKIPEIQKVIASLGGDTTNMQVLRAIAELNLCRKRQKALPGEIEQAKQLIVIVIEARKQKEQKKTEAEKKLKKEKRRNQPGSATGEGQSVNDKWLENASKGLGAPVPKDVADKLRNRKFNNFDEFREAFWLEVSKKPELLKQLSKSNQVHIKKGRAPYTKSSEQVGGRQVNELHHVIPISQDGGVYDMDNITVTTPKLHISIHKGNK